jgi:hypothetical protein
VVGGRRRRNAPCVPAAAVHARCMRVPAVGQRRGGAEEEWLRRRDYGSETVTTHRDLAFLPEDGTGVTGRVWGGARRPEVGQVACRMHGTHVQACGARRVAPGRHVLLRELGAWEKTRGGGSTGRPVHSDVACFTFYSIYASSKMPYSKK